MPTRPKLGGGVGDGQSGLVALEVERVVGNWKDLGYRREIKRAEIAAETNAARKVGAFNLRKLYAMHGDMVVCLLGGWQLSGKNGPLSTSIEQCRMRGEVRVSTAVGQSRAVAGPEQRLESVRWVTHHGMTYLPLTPSPITVMADAVKGNWSSVVKDVYPASDPANAVTDQLFRIVLPHGTAPTDTGYALVAGEDPAAADRLAQSPPWRVLANGRALQAVAFENGPTMVAFYEPGEIEITPGRKLSVDRPCLVLMSGEKLKMADPLFEGTTVTVGIDNKSTKLKLPRQGDTVEVSFADLN